MKTEETMISVPLSVMRRIFHGSDAAYRVVDRIPPAAWNVDAADLVIMRLGNLVARAESGRVIRDEDARRASMFPARSV